MFWPLLRKPGVKGKKKKAGRYISASTDGKRKGGGLGKG